MPVHVAFSSLRELVLTAKNRKANLILGHGLHSGTPQTRDRQVSLRLPSDEQSKWVELARSETRHESICSSKSCPKGHDILGGHTNSCEGPGIIHSSSFNCLLSRALQIPSLGLRTVMLKSDCLYSMVNKAVSFLRSIYLERRTWGGIIMHRA